MTLPVPHVRLKVPHIQIIETADAVILKRGCTEFKVSGVGATEAIKLVLNATGNQGATLAEICEQFDPQSHPIVEQLLEELFARRLLICGDAEETQSDGVEGTLDVFYWHFDEQAARVTERLNKRQFVIMGVNFISRQLASSFATSGVQNFLVIDHPFLRNLSFFDAAGKLKSQMWPATLKAPQEWSDDPEPASFDCLIAISDFGRSATLRELNKYCAQHNRTFLPVVLQNMVGYVGPLVVPGETACFECLMARQNSHLKYTESHQAIENMAFEGQRTIGFHPSMASILAEIASFELTKFYGGTLNWKVGTLIEVDMLATRLTTRKVLKIPRCKVCSPLHVRPSISPKKNLFTRGEKANS